MLNHKNKNVPFAVHALQDAKLCSSVNEWSRHCFKSKQWIWFKLSVICLCWGLPKSNLSRV